jgi:hypothetical protein
MTTGPASPASAGPGESWAEIIARWTPNGIVFMSSLCFMSIEMCAGRLVSRHIGSSIYTWTTVIGVHFAGMSIGNYLGGRLAARWRPKVILGQLFLLASFLCLSVLWLNRALGGVNDTSSWPSARYSLACGVEVTSNTLAILRDAGTAEDVVKRIEAALRGRTYSTEERLVAAIPADLVAFKEAVLAAAEPMGPAYQGMREDGVPDAVLQALRKLADRKFTSSGEIEDAVERAIGAASTAPDYNAGDVAEFRKSAVKHAREDSVFQFPIRLIAMTAFIFLAPALALGLISPVAAQMAIDACRTSGRAVGNVYAWGAVGSIIGTFLTGFVAVSTFFVYSLIALTSLVLASIAVAVATPRLLQCVWLSLLSVLVVLVVHQRRGATALDLNPEEVDRRNRGESNLQELWHKLPEQLGNTIRIRDEDLSDHTLESNYQFIKVSKRSHGDAGGAKDLLVLSLDHLIHGYVKLKMPKDKADKPFNEDDAVFDETHLHYAYEEVYALSAARAVVDRFREEPGTGRMLPPKMKGLFLGGGSYTFQRYMVDTYPGEEYVVAPGDTLSSIVRAQYKPDGKMVDSEARDLEDRVRRFNAAALGGQRDDQLEPGTRLTLPSLSDVAELDPMVTEVNHTRLKLKRFDQEPRIKTWNYDARNFVESASAAGWTERYDVIFQDAFNHYSVPYHLTTKEFNDKVGSLLTKDGVYICNVIDKYETARFMSATVVTMRASFDHVYVLGDKRRSQRYGRETFVVVGKGWKGRPGAADAPSAPLNLEHLGGYSDRVLRPVKDVKNPRDPEDPAVKVLRERLGTGDAVGLEQILARLEKETPEQVYQYLLRLKKVDFRVLHVSESDDPEDVRVRKSISFNDQETRDLIVEKGRPPALSASIRNMVLVRAFFGRTPASFVLSEKNLEKMREAGVPGDVLAKLTAVEGRSFSTAEAFSDRLGELLTQAELKQYKSRIVREARDIDAEKSPPLVLTDSRAPVDDLLSPLFEED